MDILSRKFRDFIKRRTIPENTPRSLIIKHLERLSAHDLEPVHDTFDASVGIEMCVGDYLLLEGDVLGGPAEENGT